MERILHDTRGTPVAFLANDGERTICLWDGRAVAYIDDQLNCYGWNGKYLGWVEGGHLFDPLGRPVGYLKFHASTALSLPPIQGVRAARQAKREKGPAPSRPEKRQNDGHLPLAEILKAGALPATAG